MTTKMLQACMFALACIVFAGSSEGKAWQSPEAATLDYLVQILRVNEPGITDLGVAISRESLPIELLFQEEVIREAIGSRSKPNSIITYLFQFPKGCQYLSYSRRDMYDRFPMSYSEVSTGGVRAYVTITEFNRHDDKTLKVATTTIEAEFHDQCDANKDGQWDRKTCWEILKTKKTVVMAEYSFPVQEVNDK